MDVSLVEGNGSLDLDRHRPELHRDAERSELRHHLAMEFRDRARLQSEAGGPAVAADDDETMVDEIEIDLEIPRAVWHRRGGEAARGDIERHLPPMIDQRCLRQADLPDHLRPQMQSRTGIAP